MAGGDGLSDCDAHGTIVASMIGAAAANGAAPPPVGPRKPVTIPTTEPPPKAPPPQTVTLSPLPQTVTVVPPVAGTRQEGRDRWRAARTGGPGACPAPAPLLRPHPRLHSACGPRSAPADPGPLATATAR